MVECFLGSLYSKSQWQRFRGSNAIHPGTRIFVIISLIYLPTTIQSFQHQAHQHQHRQAAQQRIPGPPLQQLPIGQQPQPSMGPQPISRPPNALNGIPSRPGLSFTPTMPNGVSGPMQPGGPTVFPMQSSLPNGLPGQPGPPPPGSAPPAQPQAYQQLHPGQRPSISGPQQPQNPQQPLPPQGQPPQRVQQNGPFQSPTMAHSPQNPPGQQPPQHPQQPPPMSQLAGPSPHLQHLTRGGMHPPQGMNSMNSQQGPGPGGNSSSASGFQRSPSRSGTPGQGQGGMPLPSPSMASRQPPGVPGITAAENHTNAELLQIPQSLLQQLKQEAGVGAKDLPSLTLSDKVGFRASSGNSTRRMLIPFVAKDIEYASTTETWRRTSTAKQCNCWSFEHDDATSQSWTEQTEQHFAWRRGMDSQYRRSLKFTITIAARKYTS